MLYKYLIPYILSVVFGVANISYLIMILSKVPITVLEVRLFIPAIGQMFSEAYVYIFADIFFVMTLIPFFKSIKDHDQLKTYTYNAYKHLKSDLRFCTILYLSILVIMYITKSPLLLFFLILSGPIFLSGLFFYLYCGLFLFREGLESFMLWILKMHIPF